MIRKPTKHVTLRTPSGIALTAILATAALAQTSSTTRKPPTHRTHPANASTSSNATSPTSSPADNPPNVPPIAAIPRPLYALRYVDTLTGSGELAPPRKYYSVRYTGWLTDGTKFDSSDDHPGKAPISFPYGAHGVIMGWDTGFEGMHVGGKRRLYIPYQLAYGESGRPPVIPAKSDLIFDIELVSVSDTPPAPPAEPKSDPASQPSDQPSNPDTATPPETTKPGAQPATPTDPTKPTSATPPPSSNLTTPQLKHSSPK